MPAAAVIPAPIAYIKVVAVKKLVVGFLDEAVGPPLCGVYLISLRSSLQGSAFRHSVVGAGNCIFYCEKIRVFKAGILL